MIPTPGHADARLLNWRFVAPSEPDELLLLPAEGESVVGTRIPAASPEGLDAALAGGPYPAVVVADLRPWAVRGGCEPTLLLARLADAVAPGGWLLVQFANPLYPIAQRRVGALTAKTVERTLSRSGLAAFRRYLCFPDHVRPAYLVSTDSAAELEYFLRMLFIPYVPQAMGRARLLARVLTIMRSGALLLPAETRVRLAPAHVIVADRLPAAASRRAAEASSGLGP